MKTNLHIAKIMSLFALILTQSLLGVAMPCKTAPLHQRKAIKHTTMQEKDEILISTIAQIHNTLSDGIKKSKPCLAWLKAHGLSIATSGAVYNSGHPHIRKDAALVEKLIKIHFLRKLDVNTPENRQPSYNVFGKLSVVFPLKDQHQLIINYYAIHLEKEKIEYLNRKGIYPCYPKEQTTKLYIVPTILDAATLLESKILKPTESVISLFDGKIMPQHEAAIENLKFLQEIIWLETSKK